MRIYVEAKSFKINFVGNKSGCVIYFKFSKADCVQVLVLALVLPRGIFCDFSFCVPITVSAVWVPSSEWCKLDGSFPFH